MNKQSLLRLVLLLILAATAIAAVLVLPIKDYLEQFLAWVRDLGPLGPMAVSVAYVPATVLFVPGTILTLGAGFAFGVIVGTVAISLGSTAGAAAAFLVGRFIARDWIEKRVAGSPRFQAIDQAVAEQGFKIVLLTRLSPVFPFNVLNYAFSLTKVRFRDYLLASWIGMLPATVMYVYLGSLVGNVAELATGKVEKPASWYVLFAVGLLATVGVTIYVTRVARQALARALPPGYNEQGESPDRSES